MTQGLFTRKPLANSIGTAGVRAMEVGVVVSIIVALVFIFDRTLSLPDVYFSHSASVRSGEKGIRECVYIEIRQNDRWVKIDCDREILNHRYAPHWIK